MPVAAADMPKTAVITHFGLWEHKKDPQRVMERLVINKEKCQLFKPQVEFLGHLEWPSP